MSENDTGAGPVSTGEPKPDELNKSNTEITVNNSQSSDSEPPAKKQRESRRSKGIHKSIDELAADEARAVCGDVDTSSGRQLRKREPPPEKATKKPVSRTSSKKETAAEAKKGSPTKNKAKKNEKEDGVEDDGALEDKEGKSADSDEKESASGTSEAEQRLDSTSAAAQVQGADGEAQKIVSSEAAETVVPVAASLDDTKPPCDAAANGTQADEARSGETSHVACKPTVE